MRLGALTRMDAVGPLSVLGSGALGRLGALAVCAVVVIGCGGRDVGEFAPSGELVEPLDGGVGPNDCRVDSDCPTDDACFPHACRNNRCVALEPIDCDDGDPCTQDACNAVSGECSHEPVTPDVDGDGYRRPLPGFLPGAPGSCGSDCNDLSAAAYPGGLEVCDGVDNDCNGVVDDGYTFEQSRRESIVIAEASAGAEAAGLLHLDGEYVALVTKRDQRYQAHLEGFTISGSKTFSSPVVLSNNDTFGGSLAWSGQVLAVAWEDRRDGDYEIYFNRFDREGQKVGPDLRVSDAIGFSLDPVVMFTGTGYLVTWTDGRNGSNRFSLYAQPLSILGVPNGPSVSLTPEYQDARAASMVLGATELGLTFTAGGDIVFRTLQTDLTPLSPPVVLSDRPTAGGGVVYALDRYIVTWSEYESGIGPGDAIWGAIVDKNGTILRGAQPLTPRGGFARSHSVLTLGDRLFIAWANDWGESYDIFAQMFSLDLEPWGDPMRLTTSPLDELSPRLRFGSNGELALVYTERTNDRGPRVLLQTLSCR